MSERNAKMKHQQDEIEFLNSMLKVKDRLILEFMINLTVNKVAIQPHVIEIVEQLYPGRMKTLDALAKKIEDSQCLSREIIDKTNANKKEKANNEKQTLRLVETEKES